MVDRAFHPNYLFPASPESPSMFRNKCKPLGCTSRTIESFRGFRLNKVTRTLRRSTYYLSYLAPPSYKVLLHSLRDNQARRPSWTVTIQQQLLQIPESQCFVTRHARLANFPFPGNCRTVTTVTRLVVSPRCATRLQDVESAHCRHALPSVTDIQ